MFQVSISSSCYELFSDKKLKLVTFPNESILREFPLIGHSSALCSFGYFSSSFMKPINLNAHPERPSLKLPQRLLGLHKQNLL